MKDERDRGTRTLEEGDIESARHVGRRRATAVLGVGTAALVTGCGGHYLRRAHYRGGLTDHDNGPCYTDPVGGGIGRSTGLTDSDGGPCADPAGRGRVGLHGQGAVVAQPHHGVTDSDVGACADPVGGGTRGSGLTDSDHGPCADPAGSGRSGH